jgi:hypothetical protein
LALDHTVRRVPVTAVDRCAVRQLGDTESSCWRLARESIRRT